MGSQGGIQQPDQRHGDKHDVDDIAEVVAMMTGIPTKRIAETESKKLLKMKDILKTVHLDNILIKEFYDLPIEEVVSA